MSSAASEVLSPLTGVVNHDSSRAESKPSPLVKNVVFFGFFGPPCLTILRSFRAMGISVHLLTLGELSGLKRSCFSSVRTLDSSLVGTSEGIDDFLSYVSEVKADAVATLSEMHCLWLAKYADRFPSTCKLMLPSIGCLESVEGKLHQINVAHDVGFSVLPTYVIRGLDDLHQIESKHYPLCLRPSMERTVQPEMKVQIIRSSTEMADFIGAIRTFGDGIIAQPFHSLPNAVMHCTSGEDGELLSLKGFLADRKFEFFVLRIRPLPVPDDLVQKVAAFSRILKLSGPFHFDFLYSPETGEWHYLEVNVRFGGTTDKVRWLGVNEPANCLMAYGLAAPRTPKKYSTWRYAVVNKVTVLKHLLATTRRGPDMLDFPLESRFAAAVRSIGDLLFAKDSITDFGDIRGTIASRLSNAQNFLNPVVIQETAMQGEPLMSGGNPPSPIQHG